jgi:hypothetical protein
MSNDEQMAAIGRMIFERSELRKQRSLRLQEIQQTGLALESIGNSLRSTNRDFTETLKVTNTLITGGGLDALKTSIVDYQRIQLLLANIEAALKNAGVD